MQMHNRTYSVRIDEPGGVVRWFIRAKGYRDALRLQQKYGGKILGGPKKRNRRGRL